MGAIAGATCPGARGWQAGGIANDMTDGQRLQRPLTWRHRRSAAAPAGRWLAVCPPRCEAWAGADWWAAPAAAWPAGGRGAEGAVAPSSGWLAQWRTPTLQNLPRHAPALRLPQSRRQPLPMLSWAPAQPSPSASAFAASTSPPAPTSMRIAAATAAPCRASTPASAHNSAAKSSGVSASECRSHLQCGWAVAVTHWYTEHRWWRLQYQGCSEESAGTSWTPWAPGAATAPRGGASTGASLPHQNWSRRRCEPSSTRSSLQRHGAQKEGPCQWAGCWLRFGRATAGGREGAEGEARRTGTVPAATMLPQVVLEHDELPPCQQLHS